MYQKNIKELIVSLEEHVKYTNKYFESQSKISHADYCKGGYSVDATNKTINIWCDNITGFNKNGIKQETKIYKKYNWIIKTNFTHSKNNLTCLKYCEIFSKSIGFKIESNKGKRILDYLKIKMNIY